MEIVRIHEENKGQFQDVLMEPGWEEDGELYYQGILEDGQAAAGSVYTLGDGQVNLFSIYVQPRYRSRGFGKLLLEEAMKEGRKAGMLFLNTSFFLSQNEVYRLFYNRGFVIAVDHTLYAIEARALINSEYVKKRLFGQEYPGYAKTFDRLKKPELLAALRLLSQEGYPVSRISKPGFLQELSVCVFDAKGKELGCIITFSEGLDLVVDYMMIRGRGRPELLVMLRDFISVIRKAGYQNSLVFFQAEEEAVPSIVEKLIQAPPLAVDMLMSASLEL